MSRYRTLWAKYLNRPWEEIDTADPDNPEETMLAEYRMAYGAGWVFEWR